MLNPQLNFLISAIHRGCCMSTKDILSWMKKKNNEICYHLQQIPLKNLKDWTDKNDKISHSTGKFFSIQGIRAPFMHPSVITSCSLKGRRQLDNIKITRLYFCLK